ncbi:MAG: CHAP domain-containing protein [Bacilli bacterium]|nr:CHAP domain-containing protein [Bacilli bacterium]
MSLTYEEKIKRIEMAPLEMQAMVAKAFIREDIEDENVQYLFNTDTIEQLNDPNEESNVENIDAEEVEGIGAGNFFIRTTKPNGNKNFIRTANGGWNTCIKGYPTDAGANVLANCVGYASGRFNEIINEARGTTGCTYKYLNCNAENFIERAKSAGLKTGSTPRVGAIGCAMKGSTLNGGDGAGHVWIVEKVNSATSTYTSESGYGGTAFWNQTRTNSNGRWGLGSSYTFRAYIYLPDDVQKIVDGGSQPVPTPTPGPSDKFNIGDKVVINGPLYVSSNASSPSGSVSNKTTTITRKAVGAAHPYNTSGDLGWMDESSIKKYEEPKPTPAPSKELKVGDKVKIIGTGNGSSYGTSNTAYGLGWTRQILGIYTGRPFPYRVGNSTGTTGFYAKNALEKK